MFTNAIGYQAADLLEKARIQSDTQTLTDIWISPTARAVQVELEDIIADIYCLENDLRQFLQCLESVQCE